MKNNNFFEPKEILCPIDFSDLSSLALKYAAAAAVEFNAGLTVLHAQRYEVPRYFSQDQEEQLMRELKNAKTIIQKDLRLHTEKIINVSSSNLSIDYEAIDRHPVEAILNLAKEETFGLIVMGTHGYRGLKRLFLGSVTENIIREARIPVFTIRQKEHGFVDVNKADIVPTIEHILCPCNPVETAISPLRTAVSIAERFRSQLTVLFCVEEMKNNGSLRREKENFDMWTSKIIGSRFPVTQIVCEGNAAEQIILAAHEKKCDMIVIGANHKPFMDSSFLGKTTELVLRQAPVPVMAVPNYGMLSK